MNEEIIILCPKEVFECKVSRKLYFMSSCSSESPLIGEHVELELGIYFRYFE